MKICFYALRPFDELLYCKTYSDKYGIDFTWTEDYPDEKNVGLATECDAVSVPPCDMGAHMLELFASRGVRYVVSRAIGYENIDRVRARDLGMKVANVGYPPNGIANYSIMLMMMMLRRVNHILKRMELQDYSLMGEIGQDISGCTVGVIGAGHIGSTVIKHLSSFGCTTLVYDIQPTFGDTSGALLVPLDELYKRSDVITLHANATAENHHMLNAAAFAKMKDGVIIVNTARGSLIDTGALIEALESGKVGGAALDVLENENDLYHYNRIGDVINDRELAMLRSFPNVVLTPHTAFYTDEDVASMIQSTFEAVRCFAADIPTEHDVSLT